MDSSAMIVLVNLVSLVLGGLLTAFGAYSFWPWRFRKTSAVSAALLVAVVSALTAMELRASQRMEEGRQAEARATLEKERLSERVGLKWEIQAQETKERAEEQERLERERKSLENAIRVAPEQLRLMNPRRQYASPSIRGKVVILTQDDDGAAFVARPDNPASASVAGGVSETRRGVYIPNLFDRLSDGIRAKSLEEIGTIALLRKSEEQIGVYVRESKSWLAGSGGIGAETPTKVFGYVVIYRMELIDNLMGAIIAEKSFRGSPPAMKREAVEGWEGKLLGAAPDDKVLEFLEGLPRGQAGKSQERDKTGSGASYGGEWRGVARSSSEHEFRISFTVNADGRMEGLFVYVGALCCGYAFKPDQGVEIRGKTFEARVRATTSPYYGGVVRGRFDSQQLASGRLEVKTGQKIDCGGGKSMYLSSGYGEDWHAMRREWRFPLEEEKGRAGCR